jgi:hypothetical protein
MSSQTNFTNIGLNNKFYYRESKLNEKIQKIPLVLVLGWAGSNDKNVFKYAQMYENFGYHTIRIAPSTRLSVFQSHLHKEYAIKLLELIKSKPHLDESPIIVHTFSNAGTFFYRYFSEILNENNNPYDYLRKNVKTVIYDSGPGLTNNIIRLINTTARLVENSVKSKILAYLITIVGMLIFVIGRIFSFSRESFFHKNINALKKDKFEIPILAFYSKADEMVEYTQTMDFFKERQKLVPNLRIETVLFDDSAHCMHYAKHKDVYLNKIKQHLNGLKIPIFDI